MTQSPKYAVGANVFVHNPSRFINEAVYIVGFIISVRPVDSTFEYEIVGECSKGPNRISNVSVFQLEADIGLRVGIPISQLDGRNGGNQAWRDLSRSWGYD